MKISSMDYLFKKGLKNVWNNRLMSFASIGVLASCLILTGVAILFSLNLSTALKSVEKQNMVTVYLNENLSNLESVRVGEKIKNISNVESCSFYSKDEAIEKWRDELGVLFEGFEGDDNPLPNVFHVTMTDLSNYSDTVAKIKNVNGVENISDRSDTAEKLTRLNKLVTITGFSIVIILGCISLFIISNTISITMYSRRLEISIMKSVGATDAFVKIPFIVEGIIIGMISALLSFTLLSLVYEFIISAIKQVLPFNTIPFSNISIDILLIFLTIGIMFGVLGGTISIRKYLRKDRGDKIDI